jgi:hypothetical protein
LAHPVTGRSIRVGFAVRRRRTGVAPRSIHPVDVIATYQTGETRDE